MEATDKKIVTVKALIHAPVEVVWKKWTTPEEIMKWNYASDDWHSPKVVNDVRTGGKFNIRMEARDGSAGFDFTGVYEKVTVNVFIEYLIDDGRKVKVYFIPKDDITEVIETFEAENVNPVEMQRSGWQAILDNFKKHVENNN
jgi:uncharacterized protein YndB with AHSA1/START domain